MADENMIFGAIMTLLKFCVTTYYLYGPCLINLSSCSIVLFANIKLK